MQWLWTHSAVFQLVWCLFVSWQEPKREGPDEKKVKVEEKKEKKKKTEDIPAVQIYQSPGRVR